MIYQGFGLSRGKKSKFGIDLMREYLKKRLDLEGEDKIIEFIGGKIDELKNYKIPRGDLLVKDIGQKLFEGKSYGFISGKEIIGKDFLMSSENYDSRGYIDNFLESFGDVLYTGFNNTSGLERVFH